MSRLFKLATLSLLLLLPSLLLAQSQVLNDSSPAVGDQPEQPGPLQTSLSPKLTPHSIQAAMSLVAHWQSQRVLLTASRDWTFATLYMGMLAAADTLHAPEYSQQVLHVAEYYHWELGPRLEHADDQAIGQVYLALNRQHPSQERITPLRTQFDQILQKDVPNEELPWWWCDALFMAPPVWSGLAQATGDSRYLDYMDREWHRTDARLWDNQEHLYSRDKSYLTKYEPNGKKLFWSRGNGWVMGGIVDILKTMPSDDSRRSFYEHRLSSMAERLASIQGKDGLWRAGLLDAHAYAEPETSGSAFILYAIAWGVETHLLDRKKYMPVLGRGWAGLLQHIYADGRLGDIQPVGEAPGHYKPGSSYVFGVGAFLLAGSELNRLVSPENKR